MVTLPVWFAFLQIILSIALAMYQVWNSRNKNSHPKTLAGIG